MEVAVGAAHHHLVAGFQRENIARSNTGHHILESDLRLGLHGRSGNAHGKHYAVALGRIVGHGVGAHCRFGVAAPEAEQAEFLPCGQILIADEAAVDVLGIVHLERRNLYLRIGTWYEVHMLAGGERHDELLDERGHIAVGNYLAFPFPDIEYRCRHFDVHVAFHLHLACQTPVVLYLLAGEVHGFGGQNLATTFAHLHAALAAAAFAATSRGQKHIPLRHSRQQRHASGGLHLAVVVDCNGNTAALHQIALCDQQHYHEQHHHNEEAGDAGSDCNPRMRREQAQYCGHNSTVHILMPRKLIKAMPIRAVMIKVMPTPRRGAGTLE